LIREAGSHSIGAPEHFTEDQRMFAETAERFALDEVVPAREEIEHPDDEFSVMVGLLRKAGELGLLMIDVPEEYGGLGMDITTSMLCSEKLAKNGSFAVSWGAHVGIGTLPLVFYGTDAQKAKWLPDLASGEKLAAYALTEPGSGSDALAARTKAVLSGDGTHYVLTGTKMWITNAGFADIFTVFCQVDDNKFTAFLVERGSPGLSFGAEERKMGIKGSSTRMVVLDGVKVPVGNLLGEVGRGHKIAFNILNVGRFKLGVGALGCCKEVIRYAAQYASERKQFGEPIANFGAIREKLARMAVNTYALESCCYRLARDIDAGIEEAGHAPAEVLGAIEDFVVEDSILKVYGSEAQDYCVDEAVQIHGGYGYSAEFAVEAAYRDSRIQRIFEGTNEINRMLIPGMLLKRAMKGQIPLFVAIQAAEEAAAADREDLPSTSELARERFLTRKAKTLAIYAANQAIQKHMGDLKEQQELLMLMADLIIQVYVLDSTLARTLQLDPQDSATALKRVLCSCVVASHYPRVLSNAEALLVHVAGGDDEIMAGYTQVLSNLGYRSGLDGISLRRVVAAAVIDRLRYPV
jgi:alkylation response protein AidB-like acyl-CoA dehydrogenase